MLLEEVGDEGGGVSHQLDDGVQVHLQVVCEHLVYLLDGWLDLGIKVEDKSSREGKDLEVLALCIHERSIS